MDINTNLPQLFKNLWIKVLLIQTKEQELILM